MQNTSIIDSKDAKIAELEAKLAERDSTIASLESQLEWLRKKVFGKMSEKMIPADPMAEPTLFDQELSESESASVETLKEKDEEAITKIITVKT